VSEANEFYGFPDVFRVPKPCTLYVQWTILYYGVYDTRRAYALKASILYCMYSTVVIRFALTHTYFRHVQEAKSSLPIPCMREMP